MMYLLDTNVISELRRKKPHGAVVAWVQSVPEHELFISAVTIAEIQAGIELTREQDTAKADGIERWLDRVAQTYNVLAMNVVAFRTWAKLMHRTSDTLYEDAQLKTAIASIAKTQNLTVVTRNVTDFKTFGVKVFNPFEFKTKTKEIFSDSKKT